MAAGEGGVWVVEGGGGGRVEGVDGVGPVGGWGGGAGEGGQGRAVGEVAWMVVGVLVGGLGRWVRGVWGFGVGS